MSTKNENNERGRKMNTTYAKKGTYIGTGIGIVLFVLVGILGGSLAGGAIGLKIA